MSDASYIEIPGPVKKRHFWTSRLGLFLLLIICIASAVVAGLVWQENGRLTSSYASVDASIYTVEPETALIVREVLARKGENVFAGQPLAMVEVAQPQDSMVVPDGNVYGLMPMGEITGRLNASEQTERNMSARISQARIQEERFRQAHQNYVTQHVRAQLELRAADINNSVAWATAQANEEAARAQMNAAREQYENVSKMRAAMDSELARIRNEILRNKNAATRSAGRAKAAEPQAPPPPKVVDTTLLAPANGKIIEVLAAQGQQAQAGQPLFYIMPSENGQPADCWINAWYPLSAQADLKPGLQAVIKIGEWTFGGRVAAVVPTAQELPAATKIAGESGEFSRYVVVRIVVDETQSLAEIGPGSSATCIIQTRKLPFLADLF